MNDVDTMLVKQFLLRVRQEGFSIVENPPRSLRGINLDIFRGKTKICTFDDRQLGERWNLRVITDDSARPNIKDDYHKLFYMFIYLRDLYMIYEAAEPLRGYSDSLGYRAITQHNNYTLAVTGRSRLGELEFGTFFTDRKSHTYSSGYSNIIRDNIYFDMDAYPLAKLDFVARSGLLPKEQLITPDNIELLRGSCESRMVWEGGSFDEKTAEEYEQTLTDLKKAEESFRDVNYRISAIPAHVPQYVGAKILAVKGIFTKQDIDRSTLPKGLHAYYVQYSRDEMKPELLWNNVLGRRFGTVITKKPLPIGEKGYTELRDNDFTLNPEKRPTLREFQAKNRERER